MDCAAHDPIPRDIHLRSRRKRSCCDYAKFEPDVGVDKWGGTLRDNKIPWITGPVRLKPQVQIDLGAEIRRRFE